MSYIYFISYYIIINIYLLSLERYEQVSSINMQYVKINVNIFTSSIKSINIDTISCP